MYKIFGKPKPVFSGTLHLFQMVTFLLILQSGPFYSVSFTGLIFAARSFLGVAFSHARKASRL